MVGHADRCHPDPAGAGRIGRADSGHADRTGRRRYAGRLADDRRADTAREVGIVPSLRSGSDRGVARRVRHRGTGKCSGAGPDAAGVLCQFSPHRQVGMPGCWRGLHVAWHASVDPGPGRRSALPRVGRHRHSALVGARVSESARRSHLHCRAALRHPLDDRQCHPRAGQRSGPEHLRQIHPRQHATNESAGSRSCCRW